MGRKEAKLPPLVTSVGRACRCSASWGTNMVNACKPSGDPKVTWHLLDSLDSGEAFDLDQQTPHLSARFSTCLLIRCSGSNLKLNRLASSCALIMAGGNCPLVLLSSFPLLRSCWLVIADGRRPFPNSPVHTYTSKHKWQSDRNLTASLPGVQQLSS